jgi:hypothetical protein
MRPGLHWVRSDAVRDAILDDDPEPMAKSECQLAGRDEASGDL